MKKKIYRAFSAVLTIGGFLALLGLSETNAKTFLAGALVAFLVMGIGVELFNLSEKIHNNR